MTIDDELPEYTGPPVEAPATRWSNGRIGAALFGVAALLAGGFFAVMAATGGGDGPATAVERLFDAWENEDALGMLAALDPEEREALQPGLEGIVGELQRLGVLADDLDLGAVRGLDFEFDDLELTTAILTDDLVAVTVADGTASFGSIPAEAPLGPVFDGLELDKAEPTTEVESIADEPLTLVTIRRGDSWYVSIGYSIAEAVRGDDGFPFPDPADALVPDGADSASQAVEELLAALGDLDARRVIELLPPGEMDVLHHFAPVFLPSLEETAEQARAAGFALAFRDLEMEERRDGDVVRLSFLRATAEFTVPEAGTIVTTFDGECTTIEAGVPLVEDLSSPFGSAFGDDNRLCLSDLAEEGGFLGLFAAPQAAVTSFTTVEVDGQWYVSPTRTTLDLLVQVLRLIDEDAVDSLLQGGLFALFGTATESIEVTESAPLEPYDEPQPLTVEGDGGVSEAEQACFEAMDRYGRIAAEQEASGGSPNELPPFPPPECDS